MINLRVLKVLLTYHLNVLQHKADDIATVVSEIATLGPCGNCDIAQEVLMLLQ